MFKINLKNNWHLFFKKLPLILAKKAFWVFLGFVIFVVIFDAFLIVRYIWLPKKKEVKILPKEIEINQKVFEQFLEKYKQRQERFNQVEKENYIDIFLR